MISDKKMSVKTFCLMSATCFYQETEKILPSLPCEQFQNLIRIGLVLSWHTFQAWCNRSTKTSLP